jgi:glycosyltransferase involved in cell wall biosynthesis
MNPLITYVLYAYNEERFIKEAIDSAFAQTYSPLEIVLSDDGSTDRTFEIMLEMAAAYKGPHRVILNRNEKNVGIGSQLNAAVAKTRGVLVVLANGDDISVPNRVDKIVREWELHGMNATAVWSELAVVGSSGQTTGRVMRAKRDFRDIPQATRERFGGPGAASLAVRRDCFDRFGMLMENLILEDGPLNLRATLLGEWLFIDEPLVKYRVHAENISQAYHIEEFERWRKRHHERSLWQRREGQKAFLQMSCDLYSPATTEMDQVPIQRARAVSVQQLQRDQFLECYYSDHWAPSLLEWWREWARWTGELTKVTIKMIVPWIERRNDQWHYKSACAAANSVEPPSPSKGRTND